MRRGASLSYQLLRYAIALPVAFFVLRYSYTCCARYSTTWKTTNDSTMIRSRSFTDASPSSVCPSFNAKASKSYASVRRTSKTDAGLMSPAAVTTTRLPHCSTRSM